MLDEKVLFEDLSHGWLGGLAGADAESGRALLRSLVSDWAREANSSSDPAAVNQIQRDDLDRAATGKDAAGRLDVLRAEVAKRHVNRLSAKSYQLGTAFIDGKLEPAAAKSDGEALLKDIDAVQPEVKSVHDAGAQKRLQRDLNDARMEALYLVERKAMSMRLNRYQQDRKK
jgi:hypothetical protein